MITINEYLNASYRIEVVEDPDEGGYVVSFPDLPGCFSSGKTIQEAVENVVDAKKERITIVYGRDHAAVNA